MNSHQFTEPRPEWEPNWLLEKQIAEARRRMGEARWHRLMKEWDREDD